MRASQEPSVPTLRFIVVMILLMAVVPLIVGCPPKTFNPDTIPQTPEDRLASFQTFYSFQWDQYHRDIKKSYLTGQQKDFLETKYEVLKKLKVAISQYKMFVRSVYTVGEDNEADILELIDMIGDSIIRRVD